MTNKTAITKQDAHHKEIAEREEWIITPPADIYDDGDAFVFKLNMPGVSEKNLDINVENNELSVRGRQDYQFPENMEILHEGWSLGTYARSFSLPSDVDTVKISAKLKNGVLTITVPKSEEAKPRKIKVITE